MTAPESIQSVMVTGATGFVGRRVIRRLLACGIKPICVVRSPRKLFAQHPDVDPKRLTALAGSVGQKPVLQRAADLSQAVVHLVGIIIQRRLHGQSFQRIHVDGTRNVVEAARRAGIHRFIHLSALGVQSDADSAYHRTKWVAEECVRSGNLDWTIFRPSLIHGPRGEFMRLMRRLICGAAPPLIPYFGSGRARIQPVSVHDVAHCVVEALLRAKLIGSVLPLGGPTAYTWMEFYQVCRALLPGARTWKPFVSIPVPMAYAMSLLTGPPLAVAELVVPSVGIFRFDRGQVWMSQQDCICDHTSAQSVFGIRMRSFEEELAGYADQIE